MPINYLTLALGQKILPLQRERGPPLHCGICPSTPPSLHDLLPSKVIGKEPSAWASKREAVRLGHAARTFRVNRRQVYSTPSTQCQNPAIRPLMVAMVSWSRSILQEERVAGFREIADWPILGDWIDGPRHHRQGHSGIAGPGGSGRTGRERKESGKAENRGGEGGEWGASIVCRRLGAFRIGQTVSSTSRAGRGGQQREEERPQ